jgi:hypothetical protein
MAKGDVLQLQCGSRAKRGSKSREKDGQNRHRNRIPGRRVTYIISERSGFTIGTIVCALVQSWWRTAKPPMPAQVAFNAGVFRTMLGHLDSMDEVLDTFNSRLMLGE